MKKALSALALALATLVGPAAAQPNMAAAPLHGPIRLEANFLPDPRVINVTAGGTTDASGLGLPTGCVGQISVEQPDLRITYKAGPNPLTIKVKASIDTTLIVNGPDGSWQCNDDANGINPMIRYNTPESGQYDIWIGTYGSVTGPAAVEITELI